jgi:co-chaperonin GroES (HSP10)
VAVRAKLREISQAAQFDPKNALLNALPAGAHLFECFHNKVLVATYVRPEKTKGGIILADRSQAEDRFQGSVGLVIKTGPLAFVDDGVVKFGGVKVEEGDWVTYRPSDGLEMFFVDDNGRDGTPCRVLEDTNIIGRVPDPALVW